MMNLVTRLRFGLLALTVCFTACAGLSASARTADVKLNEIQVLGTHNSYALGIDPTLMAAMEPRVQALMDQMSNHMSPAQIAEFAEYHPNQMPWGQGLAYSFPEGLTAQLDAGLRSLEIDVNYDPDGGRFLDPAGYRMLEENGVDASSLMPHDKTDLEKPGFKVLHMVDLDFRSSCNLFVRCLSQLKAWSDAHPGHTPIFILLEAKDQSLPLFPGATQVVPFDAAAYDALDNEILTTIGRDRIVTPDDVRGTYPTLEAGVRARNWPTLDDARGKFVFLLLTALDTEGLSDYRKGRPNLEGRAAFLRSKPGESFAAFLLLDNASVRGDEIAQRVREGYIVRARADIETFEAKANDLTRANKAFESGAQIVSTDFYRPGNVYGTDYVVSLPGGGDWRCNPVNAGPDCVASPERPEE
jgi:hypothetical protein